MEINYLFIQLAFSRRSNSHILMVYSMAAQRTFRYMILFGPQSRNNYKR